MMGSHKLDKTQLSPREKEVQALQESGLTTNQIAEQLGLARGTVDKYLRSIRERAMGAKEK
jgi:DNA-binding CsgD family transcriptional regulator